MAKKRKQPQPATTHLSYAQRRALWRLVRHWNTQGRKLHNMGVRVKDNGDKRLLVAAAKTTQGCSTELAQLLGAIGLPSPIKSVKPAPRRAAT